MFNARPCIVLCLVVMGCGSAAPVGAGGLYAPLPDATDGFAGTFGDGGGVDGGGVDAGPAADTVKLASPDLCAAANCDANAYCTDEDGKAKCVCKPRWSGNGLACIDVDECKSDNGGCDANALCDNLPGAAPKCTCMKGWDGNGVKCFDVDECKEKTADCAEHSVCQNTSGSFECVCDTGFSGDGFSGCKDIDECATGAGKCPSHATCSNTAGSFVCPCDAGYSKQGDGCADSNECSDGSATCDANAACVNTDGGYECTCKAGFSGNGKVCSEIDLCLSAKCDKNAKCGKAQDGKAMCSCNAGYDGSGESCYPVLVNITFQGAIISPRPSAQGCWDSGCDVSEAELKAIKDAAVKVAKLFKDPYVQGAAYAAQYLPLEKLVGAVTGKLSKPDATGTVKLLPDGPTLILPDGGTASDTLTPVWTGKVFTKVKLTDLVGLALTLEESDYLTNDPIGTVKLSSADLLKAMQIGKSVAVPTLDQGTGDILFVIVQVDQVALCGDKKCDASENAAGCPGDCKGGGGGGSCKGKCGKYEDGANCQCDTACVEYGDCCADIGQWCP